MTRAKYAENIIRTLRKWKVRPYTDLVFYIEKYDKTRFLYIRKGTRKTGGLAATIEFVYTEKMTIGTKKLLVTVGEDVNIEKLLCKGEATGYELQRAYYLSDDTALLITAKKRMEEWEAALAEKILKGDTFLYADLIGGFL